MRKFLEKVINSNVTRVTYVTRSTSPKMNDAPTTMTTVASAISITTMYIRRQSHGSAQTQLHVRSFNFADMLTMRACFDRLKTRGSNIR